MSNDTCLDMWHLQPERIVSAEEIFCTEYSAGFDENGLSGSRCCCPSLFWAAQELPRLEELHSHDKFHSLTARDQNLVPLYFYNWFIAICPPYFYIPIQDHVLPQWVGLQDPESACRSIAITELCNSSNMIEEVIPIRRAHHLYSPYFPVQQYYQK